MPVPPRVVAGTGLSAASIVAASTLACHPSLESRTQAGTGTITYLHRAYAAGPAVVTDATGATMLERRFEPFGTPIDERSAGSTHAIDLRAEPHTALNQFSDLDTGWSDHHARWLAPELARWQVPDPPSTTPAASFADRPWTLNPYTYATHDPTTYWDPDGNWPAPIDVSRLPDELRRTQLAVELSQEVLEITRRAQRNTALHATFRNLNIVKNAAHRINDERTDRIRALVLNGGPEHSRYVLMATDSLADRQAAAKVAFVPVGMYMVSIHGEGVFGTLAKSPTQLWPTSVEEVKDALVKAGWRGEPVILTACYGKAAAYDLSRALGGTPVWANDRENRDEWILSHGSYITIDTTILDPRGGTWTRYDPKDREWTGHTQ